MDMFKPERSLDRVQLQIVLACAVVALLSHWGLHGSGMFMSPDGWYYFELAYSLSEGRGYRDLFGEFVTTWPPLFPAFLSAFVWAFGPYGHTLVIASSVVVAAQAAAWCTILQVAFFDKKPDTTSRMQSWLIGLFVGLYVALNNQQLLADAMMYAMAPLLLLCAWSAVKRCQVRPSWAPAIMGAVVGALMLLAANKSIAFIAACGACIAFGRGTVRSKAGPLVFFVLLPVVVWIGVRALMGQTSSHPIQFGGGKYTFFEYLGQAIYGVGRQLISERMGAAPVFGAAAIVALVLCSIRDRLATRAALLSAYALLSLTVTAVLLSLTGLADELNGRLVIAVGVTGSVATVHIIRRSTKKYISVLLSVLLVLMQCYWAVVWWRHALVVESVTSGGFLRNEYRISRDYLAGPPTIRNGAPTAAPYRADWYYESSISPVQTR